MSWKSGTVLAMQEERLYQETTGSVQNGHPQEAVGRRALDTWKWAGEKISEVALTFQSVKGIF